MTIANHLSTVVSPQPTLPQPTPPNRTRPYITGLSDGIITGLLCVVNRYVITATNTYDGNVTMRRANRIDENQNEIVNALRACGAYVRIISQGDGIPDLLVGYRGFTLLLEIKDGNKPPSARTLTPAEKNFFDNWEGGMLAVVNNVDEALALLKNCV